jgi:eukaryotic-like serine/threonine-protein kinase
MAEPSFSFGEGDVLGGRYRLVALLGKGGMGAVWRAEHATLGSQVAIKLVHPSVLDNDDVVKRFLREAKAAATLRSPHVVQIFDHGLDRGIPYIVMELLEGESLAQCLAREKRLSPARTARLFAHVARAITKAHEAGVVHRNLKPDNIFLVKNDDDEVAKVLDFGIAKMADYLGDAPANVSTRRGKLLGTLHYMSPEQVRGHEVDQRTDLWSLAVIVFECLCGRVPFNQEKAGDALVEICTGPIPVPSEVAPVPAGFDAWFAKGVRRVPAERFQSPRKMAEALREVLASGLLQGVKPLESAIIRAGADTRRSSPDADTLDGGSPTLDRRPASIGSEEQEPRVAHTPHDSASEPRVNANLSRPLDTGSQSSVPSQRVVWLSSRRKARSSMLVSIAIAIAVALGVGWFALFGGQKPVSHPTVTPPR